MAAFIPDANGRGHICVKNEDGSSIVVYEQGAHLASWKTADGMEHLYLSPKAVMEDRVALRGGVPIIFPQFGSRGNLSPSHGFGRIRLWHVEDAENGHATFSLKVPIGDLTSKQAGSGDASVVLTYAIRFSNTHLKLSMKVTNLNEELPCSFQFAFHTYFAVEDLAQTLVNGFNRTPYIDQVKSRALAEEKLHNMDRVSVLHGEADRIYPKQHCAVILQEPKRNRSLHISGINLEDVVLWNPGPERCAEIKDLPDDGYKSFVCVEHGSVMKRISLPPTASWMGSQEIHLLAPSTSKESKL